MRRGHRIQNGLPYIQSSKLAQKLAKFGPARGAPYLAWVQREQKAASKDAGFGTPFHLDVQILRRLIVKPPSRVHHSFKSITRNNGTRRPSTVTLLRPKLMGTWAGRKAWLPKTPKPRPSTCRDLDSG